MAVRNKCTRKKLLQGKTTLNNLASDDFYSCQHRVNLITKPTLQGTASTVDRDPWEELNVFCYVIMFTRRFVISQSKNRLRGTVTVCSHSISWLIVTGTATYQISLNSPFLWQVQILLQCAQGFIGNNDAKLKVWFIDIIAKLSKTTSD